MSSRRGSWPYLIALAALFLAAFVVQRARSGFLAIEAERDTAVAIAREHGLSVAEAMALRDLVGQAAGVPQWHSAAALFARERARLGDPLAALVVAGRADAAELAVQEAGAKDLAWQRLQLLPEAVPGLRFLALRDRFAARDQARD